MPKVKGGLGRGMDALFGEMAEETENRIQMIPIGQIDPNKEQPRKQFDLESLDQLASSIRSVGIIQPIAAGVRRAWQSWRKFLPLSATLKPSNGWKWR